MIAFLCGKLISVQVDSVVLLVNNIGYNICVGAKSANLLLDKLYSGDDIDLFVCSITKEDGTVLYGFRKLQQKLWFVELIKINGISGKTAICIVDEIDGEQISFAIQVKDEKVFTGITGIGPKIANRIVIEAQKAPERINKQLLTTVLVTRLSGVDSSSSVNFNNSSSDRKSNLESVDSRMVSEIVEVMNTLGFALPNISKIIFDCIKDNPGYSQEEVIKSVIKEITCK